MSIKPHIFVTRKILESGINLLLDNGFTVDVFEGNAPIDRDTLFQRSQKAQGLITMLTDTIDTEFLMGNAHLKVIANYAVGINNINIKKAHELGMIVTNTPDVLTDATAEIAMGLMIAVARRFQESSHLLTQFQFNSFHPTLLLGKSLNHKTLGIVGMGRIGSRLAEMAAGAFNMKIHYTSQSEKHFPHQNFKRVELAELLRSSDFISVHTPLNETTKHLISEKEFRLMKPGTVFINTSRGEVVDSAALYHALSTKHLFGAGLDVTTPEPLPEHHPLRALDNCFILPHIGSANIETRDKMSMLCAENIINAFAGKKPYGQVFR